MRAATCTTAAVACGTAGSHARAATTATSGSLQLTALASGSYITSGFPTSYTAGGGTTFTASRYASNFGVYANSLVFDVGVYELAFAGPNQTTPTTVGLYDNATRWPFQAAGVAGFDLTSPGRGDNNVTASFTVLYADVAADGTVLDFGADFVMHDEGAATRGTAGQLRFNQAPVPEPATAGVAAAAAVGLLGRRRGRR